MTARPDADVPDVPDEVLPPVVKDAPVTYTSYLRVRELVSLQQPLSEPPHHDEMLFIVIHQVYELWFKQLLHEVDAAIRSLEAGRVLEVHKVFKRVTAIQRVLIEQIQVLETMTPQDFEVFRSRLNPASGFQSWQFRALEITSGLHDDRYLVFHEADPAVHATLQRRLEGRTIWDAFVSLLRRRGFDVPDRAPEPGSDDSERVVQALKAIYDRAHDHYDLYLTCELLVDYDELFQVWRFCHVEMVERTIGARKGTGGSSGAKYLRSTLKKRFFPELWEVRSRLGP
jgi:tryptophan 2,3-dioxygenase